MKKYKQLLISSLLAAVLISTPALSFAKDNKYGDEKDNKVASSVPMKQQNSNSLWGKIAGLFGARANAAAPARNMTPNISGITAPTVLQTGTMGTWTVNASDPQNGTLSYAVDWGDTMIHPLSILSMPAFVQTSTFTHAYLNPGTYTITFTVSNPAGLKTTSTVTVHVTGQSMSLPVISNVTATSLKPRQATVAWTTDLKSSSLVWFDTTTPTDTSGTTNISRSEKILDHSINLTKLTPNTTYYVVVGSATNAGTTKSDEVSFTTPAATDKNAPVITGVSGNSTVVAGDTETVTVNAYDPKNGPLTYSADWGDTMMRTMALAVPADVFVQTTTFDHVYDTAGTYTATFTAENSAGLKTSSTMDITVTAAQTDTTAPVIAPHEDVTAVATDANGAVVTYTAPDATDNVDATIPATCTPASGSTFPIGSTTVLCDNTDSSGNKAVETSFMVTVTAQTDTTAPVVSGIHVGAVSADIATISWTTDEPATSTVFYSTATPVDVTASGTSVSDTTLTTDHSLTLTGLTTSTLYHFIIQSADAANNTTSTSESTFTTTF